MPPAALKRLYLVSGVLTMAVGAWCGLCCLEDAVARFEHLDFENILERNDEGL